MLLSQSVRLILILAMLNPTLRSGSKKHRVTVHPEGVSSLVKSRPENQVRELIPLAYLTAIWPILNRGASECSNRALVRLDGRWRAYTIRLFYILNIEACRKKGARRMSWRGGGTTSFLLTRNLGIDPRVALCGRRYCAALRC